MRIFSKHSSILFCLLLAITLATTAQAKPGEHKKSQKKESTMGGWRPGSQ